MRRKDTTNEFLKKCMADALIRLMKTGKLQEITITEITQTADVGRVTFYRNFESKEKLLDFKLDVFFEEWFDIDDIIVKNLGYQDIIHRYFEMIWTEKEIFSILYRADALYVIQKQLMNRLWYHIEASDSMTFRKAFFSYGLYGITREWIEHGYSQSIQELCLILLPALETS